MNKIERLPKDFNLEMLPRMKGYSNFYLFENKIIKEYFYKNYDLEVIQSIASLNLPGNLGIEALYVNEEKTKFYLMSEYLKEYQTLSSSQQLISSKKQGFLLLKKLLIHLQIDHQNGFNPFDIHGGNYMVDANLNILGVDQDTSYYQLKPSYIAFSCQTFLEAFFERSAFGEYEKNEYYMNLYDKLRLLSFILCYITYGRMEVTGISCADIMISVQQVLEDNSVPFEVQNYLHRVLLGLAPSYDDYFIEELIDPLLACHESCTRVLFHE